MALVSTNDEYTTYGDDDDLKKHTELQERCNLMIRATPPHGIDYISAMEHFYELCSK